MSRQDAGSPYKRRGQLMGYSFINGQFGQAPLFEIKPDETEIIRHHYHNFCKVEHNLDDITWNDLDMDRIYELINATMSGAGDIMLYAMLREPCLNELDTQQRREIMQWALQQEEQRDEVLQILYDCGKRNKEDMEMPFLENHGDKKRKKRSLCLVVSMYASLCISIVFPNPMLLITLLLFIYSTFRYFYLHKKLEYDMDPLVSLLYHMDALHKIAALDLYDIPIIKKQVEDLSSQLRKVQKKKSIGYFENIAGMSNCFTQLESILYDTYANLIYEKRDVVRQAFACIGKLDACISAASYQTYQKEVCTAILHEGMLTICAVDMIHPLVENCVPNTIDIAQNRLLTGSNATGKSTYLKMVMLNAILAQSFGFAFAKSYEAGFFRIASSMSIHDHLKRNESTFVAELKSIQHLLTIAKGKQPSLCAIDEILRGTNTVERIAASCAILKEFTKYPCICLGATHDIELTRLLLGSYHNYHFSEQMQDGKMLFDYKIHKGVTTTRNAIQLLEVFSYDDTLVKQAKQRLQHFEQYGVWEIIDGF